ncbi:MAG: hypothetical protein JST40_12880 [Armatimonadetes bacterium]|nr:hypothetical protein [Armatimonadota bacterium]
MQKRTSRNSSVVFKEILGYAEEKLKIDSNTPYVHKGLRGDERAVALAELLRSHLPDQFAIGKGEAIDCLGNRSGELDLFVYDSATATPILSSSENSLIPAEAIYASIEVKSVLTQEEMDKAAKSSLALRALCPFKKQFVGAPTGGGAQAGFYRCPYFVFAFSSNLSADQWAQKEYDRAKKALVCIGGSMDLIDRIFVLERGVIRPQVASSWVSGQGVFLEFYVHLINFLMREKKRRPEIDWAAYAPRRKWTQLNP